MRTKGSAFPLIPVILPLLHTQATFAAAVQVGTIDLADGAAITLYACRSDGVARAMSDALMRIGRGDVSITGAEGSVAPTIEDGREVGAINGRPGGRFNTYRNGSVVDSRRSIRW